MSDPEVPGFDREALRRACHKLADQLLPSRSPDADIARHVVLGEAMMRNALGHVDFLVAQQRDPNLLTAAVLYITNHHAMPQGDPEYAIVWFSASLDVLAELMCPNTPGTAEEAIIYAALTEGLTELRADASEDQR